MGAIDETDLQARCRRRDIDAVEAFISRPFDPSSTESSPGWSAFERGTLGSPGQRVFTLITRPITGVSDHAISSLDFRGESSGHRIITGGARLRDHRTHAPHRLRAWPSYAGGPMHDAISPFASQFPQQILWSTTVDLNPQIFGGELATSTTAVLLSQRTTRSSSRSRAARMIVSASRRTAGRNGTLIWQLASDYIQPPHDWTLPFQVTLTEDRWRWPEPVGR